VAQYGASWKTSAMTANLRLDRGVGLPPPAFHAVLQDGDDTETPRADARWMLAFDGSEPVARLATYGRRDLHGAPGLSGLIGHYAARNADAGVVLLHAATAALRDEGAQRVLGPMNGSTWSRYRLVTAPQPDDESSNAPPQPPFLGEPTNPPDYPAHFLAAGFTVAAQYESRISNRGTADNERAHEREARAVERGIRIAVIDVEAFEHELYDLYALSVDAFADNVYYSAIDADSFAAMYRPMRGMLDPELVLLARGPDGALAGYAFAYIDSLGRRNGRPYRLIVKTLAVSRAWRSIGLGALLVDRLHAAARRKGIDSVVHALMYRANNSVKIGADTMHAFREYALYERAWNDG